MLAIQDVRATEAVIAAGLAKVAPNTITDPDDLRRSLSLIRAEGYAFVFWLRNCPFASCGSPSVEFLSTESGQLQLCS